jgi:hypothetical protein
MSLDAIWAKVQRRGEDECWMWTGTLGQGGQPNNSHGSVRKQVYQGTFGVELGRQFQVSAACGTKVCLNPKHLALKPYQDIDARFWQYVDKAGPVLVSELGPCWLWTGAKFRGLYGAFRMHGKIRHAARVSYEMKHGPIVGHVAGDAEREVVVMHRCDNPPCVNPDHLELGTDLTNIRDMIAKGRAPWQVRRSSPRLSTDSGKETSK